MMMIVGRAMENREVRNRGAGRMRDKGQTAWRVAGNGAIGRLPTQKKVRRRRYLPSHREAHAM